MRSVLSGCRPGCTGFWSTRFLVNRPALCENGPMNNDDLLPFIGAVQAALRSGPRLKPWQPGPAFWDDPSPWLGIPSGGALRTWMHLKDFSAWQAARRALAQAWSEFSGPPTKPVLTALILAGELELLQEAARRWPLRCSGRWCQTAFEQLLSAHYDEGAALPLPLSLGLADWIVEQARAVRPPLEPGSLRAWASLVRTSRGGQEPDREQVLLAWWHRAHALGEQPLTVDISAGGNTVLFVAVQKQMWDLAEQLLKDGADPNALVPLKGNALLTALQKERQGQLNESHRLVNLVYCMLDHGLDWHQANPFPGQATFSAFLAPNSVLERIDEHWHALRKSEALEERLPSNPPPSPARPKPRF